MHKVMIVDDEVFVTSQLEERLTSMGYDVIGCPSSGKEAVHMARSLRPDIALLDIVMPGKYSGIDAGKIINDELDIPVIFITAYANEKIINRAKEVKPFGFILKPFKINEVDALIKIALNKKETDRKLCESEKKYRLLVDNVTDVIWTTDLKGMYTYVSPSIKNLTGYSVEEALSASIQNAHPPDSLENIFQAAGEQLEKEKDMTTDPDRSWTLELEQYCKDGTKVWIEATVKILRDKDGKPSGFLGSSRDFRVQKQAENQIKSSLLEKEVLIKEIHHRVKNNLQLVSSLLSLQEESVNDENFLKIFKVTRDRIKSMSFIYEQLQNSENFIEIDITEYFATLIRELYYSYSCNPEKVQLQIEIEKINLSIDQVMYCGLIINELVSNIIKHAFPDKLKRKGLIKVAMKMRDDNNVELIVRDNGIGIPKNIDINEIDTLGLKLVKTLTENQIKGTLQLNHQNGTKFVIKFKL